MLTALDKDGSIAISTLEGVAERAPFFCPECRARLILRQGTWKIHHFAHKAMVAECPRERESEKHALKKLEIYQAGAKHPNVLECEMEYRTGTRIADVILCGAIRKVAVEVQLSPIGYDEIMERTAAHTAAGFSTLWVVDLDQDLLSVEQGTQYKVKAFQKDLHELHNEAVFVHADDLKFWVVHFMGYRYETFKHFKVSRKPLHLFDSIDWQTDGLKVVSPPASFRWWEKLKPRYPTYDEDYEDYLMDRQHADLMDLLERS